MANFNTVGLGGSLNTATNVYNLIQQAKNNQYQREQIEYAKANANFEKDLDYAQKTFGNPDAVKAMLADGTYEQSIFETQDRLQANAQALGRDIKVNLHNDWLGDAQGDLYNTVHNIHNAKSKEEAQALMEAYRAKWRGLEPIVNKNYTTIMSEKMLSTNQPQDAGQVPTDKKTSGQLGINEPSATTKSDMATTTSDINTVFTEQNNMLNNDLNKNTPISYGNMADTVLLQALNTYEANTKLTKQNAIKETYGDIGTFINDRANQISAYNYTPEQRTNFLQNLSNMENLPDEWRNTILLINKENRTPEEESKVNYMLGAISPSLKAQQVKSDLMQKETNRYNFLRLQDRDNFDNVMNAIDKFKKFEFKPGVSDAEIVDTLKGYIPVLKTVLDDNNANAIIDTAIKYAVINNFRTKEEQISLDMLEQKYKQLALDLAFDTTTFDARTRAIELGNIAKQAGINLTQTNINLNQQKIAGTYDINRKVNDNGETVINVNGKEVKPTWNKTTGALSISVNNRVTVLDGKQVALLRDKADINNEQIESMGALNATLLSKYASALSPKPKNGRKIAVDHNLQTAFDDLKLQATDPERYKGKKQAEQTVQNKLNTLYDKFYHKYGWQNPDDRELNRLMKIEFPKWNNTQKKDFIQEYKIYKGKKYSKGN